MIQLGFLFSFFAIFTDTAAVTIQRWDSSNERTRDLDESRKKYDTMSHGGKTRREAEMDPFFPSLVRNLFRFATGMPRSRHSLDKYSPYDCFSKFGCVFSTAFL